MPVLATCKFEEDPIKTEGAIMSTTIVFAAFKGILLRNQWIDMAGIQTHLIFYACPSYLQV